MHIKVLLLGFFTGLEILVFLYTQEMIPDKIFSVETMRCFIMQNVYGGFVIDCRMESRLASKKIKLADTEEEGNMYKVSDS